MIALLAITDGRDNHLGETIAALEANTDQALVTERWMFDDVGTSEHRDKLACWYPHWTVLSPGTRQGFGGILRFAWAHLAMHSTSEWVLHQEDDLVLQRPVDLSAIVGLLRDRPYLAQVALTRQPWNDAERAAGGVVQANAAAYADCADEYGRCWLEHRLFFTTNLSVYRRALCLPGWISGGRSEGRYTHHLLNVGLPWGVPGDDVRFAYWGGRTDPPLTHHIGEHRAGFGY